MTIQRLRDVIARLHKLQRETSDREYCTPDILNTLSDFVNDGLEEVIFELEEIREELEEGEEVLQ